MNRRRFVVGSAAAAAVAGAASLPGCRSSGSLLPHGFGYALNVEYGTNTIAGKTFRTRTYNGVTAGPILETRPGQTLTITVNNKLPPNPPASVPASKTIRVPVKTDMDSMMRRKSLATREVTGQIDPMNNPNNFNTTNLHVHGIQTVPHLYNPIGTSNPMAEMIAIEPGASFTYNFPIPADHPSGLYWYHPHHHGSTDVQVAGGMAGLIVVRGAIDEVPEIASAREIVLVVQSLNVNKNGDGTYGYEPIAYQPPASGGYNNGTDYTMMTVNGQGVLWIDNNANNQNVPGTTFPVPQFNMRPGEVVRIRMLNGTNAWYLPLLLRGMKCYLIGFDGVNLPAPVESDFSFTGTVTQMNVSSPSTNVLSTAPGNRIEMLVQAPSTPGTYALSVAPQSGIEMTSAGFALAQFVVSGDPVTMSIPSSLPLPSRDYPFISDSEIVAKRTIQFRETINAPQGFDTILTGFWAYINDGLFDEMKINYSPAVNTAEEWTIVNQTTCGHPFHIHVNSYEVIEVNGVAVPPTVWDTFMVPPAQTEGFIPGQFDNYKPAGSIKIRIRFREWTGKSVFHCHILTHEDTGMMNNILIT